MKTSYMHFLYILFVYIVFYNVITTSQCLVCLCEP